MVLIIDGISEIGAHVRSNLCYLVCVRIDTGYLIYLSHFFRSRAVTNQIFFFFLKKTFFHICAKCSALLSHINTMDVYVYTLGEKQY